MYLRFLFFVLISFISINIEAFSQENIKNLSIEIKKPKKICGKENHEILFYRPRDIKFNRFDGNVYVADTWNNRIVVLDEDLNFIRKFGNLGQGPGDFNKPNNIEIDNEGNHVILDFLNRRIKKVNKFGKYIISFIAESSPTPEIAVDSKNNVYIYRNFSEKDKKLINVYDYSGRRKGKFVDIIHEVEHPMVRLILNQTFIDIDEEDDIYCAFQHQPIWHKYDKKYNLNYEIKIDHLPEVKESIRRSKAIKTKTENFKNQRILRLAYNEYDKYKKYVCKSISVDRDFFYILVSKNVLYVFDKIDGKIKKKIILKADYSDLPSVTYFDAKHKDYIYALDEERMLILKYQK